MLGDAALMVRRSTKMRLTVQRLRIVLLNERLIKLFCEPSPVKKKSLKPDTAMRPTRPANRNGEMTRDRILDAAERLFSERGFDGVSMRELAIDGQVTLALVNYHFGSKDGLYRAVFERRIAPVSAERRTRLARVLGRAGPPASITEILDALARPWVELRGRPGGLAYTRLAAREAGDPAEGKRGIVAELLDPIAREFMAAMRLALPALTPQRVNWAYHFFIGSLLLILANPARVKRLSGRGCEIENDDAVVGEIVEFFAVALGGSPAPLTAHVDARAKAGATGTAVRPARRARISSVPAKPLAPVRTARGASQTTKPKRRTGT